MSAITHTLTCTSGHTVETPATSDRPTACHACVDGEPCTATLGRATRPILAPRLVTR